MGLDLRGGALCGLLASLCSGSRQAVIIRRVGNYRYRVINDFFNVWFQYIMMRYMSVPLIAIRLRQR